VWGLPVPPEVSNQRASRTPLERAATAGESPVGERALASVADLEYRPARVTGWEGWPTTVKG
jgi:hypothetical protein